MRPQRWQPTRLPSPWDSSGKNTGVGCHFLLQCMKVKSESEVVQSCLTLSDPMGCSPPGSSVRGIFQARVLEWVAIAFSRLKTSHSGDSSLGQRWEENMEPDRRGKCNNLRGSELLEEQWMIETGLQKTARMMRLWKDSWDLAIRRSTGGSDWVKWSKAR